MDDITNIAEEALKRYFNALSKLGYKNYNDVSKLLVLLFIEELLTSEFSFYITESDYKSITNALYCIMGNNCLIDLPSYATYDSLFHYNSNYLEYIKCRITEDSIIRSTEDSNIRIKI
nr:MAG TPA: hypothetical protein [Crassvirales sp.]